MKKLILLVALLVSSLGYGQITTYGNFKIENQEIIYQKVFTEDSITVQKLETFYKSQTSIFNVVADAEEVRFDITNLVIDYKKFQFSQVGTPTIIQSGLYTGKVTVGVRAGKYRVTMTNIQLTGDIGYKKITTNDKLTNYACRNSGTIMSPDWCKPNYLGLLDQAFTDKCQYVGKKKSDW